MATSDRETSIVLQQLMKPLNDAGPWSLSASSDVRLCTMRAGGFRTDARTRLCREQTSGPGRWVLQLRWQRGGHETLCYVALQHARSAQTTIKSIAVSKPKSILEHSSKWRRVYNWHIICAGFTRPCPSDTCSATRRGVQKGWIARRSRHICRNYPDRPLRCPVRRRQLNPPWECLVRPLSCPGRHSHSHSHSHLFPSPVASHRFASHGTRAVTGRSR